MCNEIPGIQYPISIIIPSFKPGDYIFECLLSLKNQTMPKELFEILIILNGPRHPYYQNIRNYTMEALPDNNVVLIYTEMSCVSNARNIGIKQSKGSFLCFIDDDDIVSKEYLLKMYTIARDGVMPLSYIKNFKKNIVENEDCYITRIYEKNINKKINILNTRSFFSVPYCKLIDKNIIEKEIFDTKFQNGEDSLFMFAISDKIKEIKFTDISSVYYHRLRENSLSEKNNNVCYSIKNNLGLIIAYTVCFIKKPFKYNFLFYISRLLATCGNMFYRG